LKEYFGRCGAIKLDYSTGGEELIKIYCDEEGKPKGDARIGYLKEESVHMALDMLNDSEFRVGYPIKVEQAQFEMKGEEYVPK